MNKHIAIEGMDGVGKSTVCQLLANRLGYKFIEKPFHYLLNNNINLYRDITKKINAIPDPNFTAWYHGLNNLYVDELLKTMNIVTDRFIVSNYCWSGCKENEDIYNVLLAKLIKPTLTVILYAPKDVIKKRLLIRNQNDNDLLKLARTDTEAKYLKMKSFCEIHQLPYLYLDTSNLTPAQIVDVIINHLEYTF